MSKFEFKPKLFLDLRGYNKEKLTADIMAGLIVGIVQYLYLHFFIGYANYTERTTAALSDFIGPSLSASLRG